MSESNIEAVEAAARLIAGRQCKKWFYQEQVDSCINTDPSCACRREAQKCFDVALPHLAPQPTQSDEGWATHLVRSECCDTCSIIDARSCGCFRNALAVLSTVRAEATFAERKSCAKIIDIAAANAAFLGFKDAAIEFEKSAAAIRVRS